MNGDDRDQIVSSENGELSNVESLEPGWRRARILEVMESWPLQLQLEVDAVEYHLYLSNRALVERAGESALPGDLRSGQRVELLFQSNEIVRLRILD